MSCLVPVFSVTTDLGDTVLINVNIGLCETNNLILDDTFVWYYQRAYVSMYVICLLVVIVLYVAVFDAVLRQRSRRQQRRRNQMTAASNAATAKPIFATEPCRTDVVNAGQVTEMVTVEQDKEDGGEMMKMTVVAKENEKPSAVVQTSKSNLL